MAGWKTYAGELIKAKVLEAQREAMRDAAHGVLAYSRDLVPLDEGTLMDSGTAYGTNPGTEPAQATVVYGGGGNTGYPVIPYAVRWHEEDAFFQHGRMKDYLRIPFTEHGPTLIKRAMALRMQGLGLITKKVSG